MKYKNLICKYLPAFTLMLLAFSYQHSAHIISQDNYIPTDIYYLADRIISAIFICTFILYIRIIRNKP